MEMAASVTRIRFGVDARQWRGRVLRFWATVNPSKLTLPETGSKKMLPKTPLILSIV